MSTIAAVPLSPHGVAPQADRGLALATPPPQAAAAVAPRAAFVISIASLAAAAPEATRPGAGPSGRSQTRIAAGTPDAGHPLGRINVLA